jgi:hypothetical protein
VFYNESDGKTKVRNEAIKEICDKLKNIHKLDLKNSIVLDFFAREGDWQTKHVALMVKRVHAWEIDEKFKKKLKLNLPSNANITIGDSFKLGKIPQNIFDIIIFDNPQGCYGPDNQYCEHFDALPLIPNLIKPKGGLIIFNIKLEPFDYEDKDEWKLRRNIFFGVKDASNLTENFVKSFYSNFFREMSYNTEFSFLVPRPQETSLYSMVAKVRSL